MNELAHAGFVRLKPRQYHTGGECPQIVAEYVHLSGIRCIFELTDGTVWAHLTREHHGIRELEVREVLVDE